jgi:hypothetical protein
MATGADGSVGDALPSASRRVGFLPTGCASVSCGSNSRKFLQSEPCVSVSHPLAAAQRSSQRLGQQARARQGAVQLVRDSALAALCSHGRLSSGQRLSDAPLCARAARHWWHRPLLAALWLGELPLTAQSARVLS